MLQFHLSDKQLVKYNCVPEDCSCQEQEQISYSLAVNSLFMDITSSTAQ